jgi:hypothetical protein
VSSGEHGDQQSRQHQILADKNFPHFRPDTVDLVRVFQDLLFDSLNINAHAEKKLLQLLLETPRLQFDVVQFDYNFNPISSNPLPDCHRPRGRV